MRQVIEDYKIKLAKLKEQYIITIRTQNEIENKLKELSDMRHDLGSKYIEDIDYEIAYQTKLRDTKASSIEKIQLEIKMIEKDKSDNLSLCNKKVNSYLR